ncbi:MAG: bis(5'-nucleosyl)-tetraphosphatase (symmetrical) YqeK [Candidatus Caldatribacteriota bacterium]|nr:bis(5'-nucleosyl)-tetraphosphatase (symmetrical) YqeK [Candidatus Caldatribacteriota bacterium]
MKIRLMRIKLKKMLSKKRWEHSINTSQVAYDLALRYGVDPVKAEVAGLLHDCAKDMETDELKSILKKNKLKIDAVIKTIPKLLHPLVGAIIAKREFNIKDVDILQAIRSHSTGMVKMTTLDKIIYLSDKIEPLRRIEGVEEARKMVKKDLDKAVLIMLDKGLISLIKRDLLIHPTTIAARNNILNKVGMTDV